MRACQSPAEPALWCHRQSSTQDKCHVIKIKEEAEQVDSPCFQESTAKGFEAPFLSQQSQQKESRIAAMCLFGPPKLAGALGWRYFFCNQAQKAGAQAKEMNQYLFFGCLPPSHTQNASQRNAISERKAYIVETTGQIPPLPPPPIPTQPRLTSRRPPQISLRPLPPPSILMSAQFQNSSGYDCPGWLQYPYGTGLPHPSFLLHGGQQREPVR